MGIQSTQEISREAALLRITYIQQMVAAKDYEGIEQASFEPDCNVAEFVRTTEIQNVERWTNRMLGDLIDMPFFRKSMFDNYQVV